MPWIFTHIILPIALLALATKLFLAWRGWRMRRDDDLNPRDYGGGW